MWPSSARNRRAAFATVLLAWVLWEQVGGRAWEPINGTDTSAECAKLRSDIIRARLANTQHLEERNGVMTKVNENIPIIGFETVGGYDLMTRNNVLQTVWLRCLPDAVRP